MLGPHVTDLKLMQVPDFFDVNIMQKIEIFNVNYFSKGCKIYPGTNFRRKTEDHIIVHLGPSIGDLGLPPHMD